QQSDQSRRAEARSRIPQSKKIMGRRVREESYSAAPEESSEPKRFQFSLGKLLLAVLYAGLMATLVVNFVGKDWQGVQIAAAYAVTLMLVAGFAVLSKARAKIADYAIVGPLIFIAAATAGLLLTPQRNGA